jgi:hypothetical protein
MAETNVETQERQERKLTPSQQARLDALDAKTAVSPRSKKTFSEEDEHHIEIFSEALYRALRRIEAEDLEREAVEEEIDAELKAGEAKLASQEQKDKPWRPW